MKQKINQNETNFKWFKWLRVIGFKKNVAAYRIKIFLPYNQPPLTLCQVFKY